MNINTNIFSTIYVIKLARKIIKFISSTLNLILMKKIGILFFSFLLIGGMQACKKEARPQVPAALLGKWSLRQYSITTTSNGVTGEPLVTAYNDTARYLYYQFDAEGSGLEQANAGPNFLAAAGGFTFRIGGNMINFSHN